MRRHMLLVMVILCALLIPLSALAEEMGDAAPGEVLIGFKAAATDRQMNAVVASLGGKVTGAIDLPKVKIRKVRLSAATKSATDEAVKSLRTSGSPSSAIVQYAEPNMVRRIFDSRPRPGDAGILSQSSDSLLEDQWGYYDVSANWLPAPSGPAPVVAVIDTGVDYTHPDLKGKVIKGKDFVNLDGDPMDDHSHGTHVAGVIAAKTNNGYGIAGISWNSKIVAVKALNSQGWGMTFEIAKAIIYAANRADVKVINMSLGGGYSATEQDAVNYAVNTKGKLLVAAAGNANTNSTAGAYPAAFALTYPGKVIAVAAHQDNRCRASFSNYGTWVSITAPGVDILSTIPAAMGNGFASFNGTSMATPHVAGAAAVVWAENPSFTNSQVASRLTTKIDSEARNKDGACWPSDASTFGFLDVYRAADPASWEACDSAAIYGYALDAESGEPLAGAKVLSKQGSATTGADYVPYYGQRTTYGFDSVHEDGFGLFNVLTNTTGAQDILFKKSKIAKPKINVPSTSACSWSYAGNIPVPPNKPYYWIAVTWDYGFVGGRYDSWLQVPSYGTFGWFNPGVLGAAPYVKFNWDSDNGDGNLRDFSESFRIKRVLSGTYLFFVQDWLNGAGSTSWSSAGMKVYVYKWNPGAGKSVLVKTITPGAGAGRYWDAFELKGNTITEINSFSD